MTNPLESNKGVLLVNRIKLPSGLYLESRHRWDFQQAEGCFVDGGLDYSRFSLVDGASGAQVYSDDPFEVIRDASRWGTYGKTGAQFSKLVKIKDLSNLHVSAIIVHLQERLGCIVIQRPLGSVDKLRMQLSLFETELEYRKEHQIEIQESENYSHIDYSDEYLN